MKKFQVITIQVYRIGLAQLNYQSNFVSLSTGNQGIAATNLQLTNYNFWSNKTSIHWTPGSKIYHRKFWVKHFLIKNNTWVKTFFIKKLVKTKKIGQKIVFVKNNFSTKKSKNVSIIHNLCLIINNYACKRRHLEYTAVYFHNKNPRKIST